MKLVTFILRSHPISRQILGVLIDNDAAVVDLQGGRQAMTNTPSPCFQDMLSFLDGGEAARELAIQVRDFIIAQRPPQIIYSLSEVQLLSPVPRPRSIRDCMVFEKHLIQATRRVVNWQLPLLAKLDTWMEKLRGKPLIKVPKIWYKFPIYYKGNPFSVVGTDADVYCPGYTQKFDYELEIGIFIGKIGRNIHAKDAHKYIGGYTIYNDFSARDIQIQEMAGRLGPAKGKDFDTGNAIGPYLVTPDEVSQPYNLAMSASINGEKWSNGNSRDMHFSFEDIIAYISQEETLYPGEFIGSGTVGNGCGLELNRWLKRGDVVELQVEGLGVLRNTIV